MASPAESVKDKRTLANVIIGPARDVHDPHIFENLSLVAFLSRFLHHHTAFELLKWLQLRGLSLVILPVRVLSPTSRVMRLTPADSGDL